MPLRKSLLLASLLFPGVALACGGFFPERTPVDQAAERIILHPKGGDTVEAWFDIRFDGHPTSFAWVLPVPGVPEDLGTVDASVFNVLDVATEPRLEMPDACNSFDAGFGQPAPGGVDGTETNNDPEGRDVEVLDRRVVGDYDAVTLAAKTADALVEWLRTNGFRVADEMLPFIDLYLGQGLNFLAIKLVPGGGAESIKPLKLTYRSAKPTVPLRLASLAAVPEMGVKIFVVADGRYTPENVPELDIPLSALTYDAAAGRGNWGPAVARAIDAHQGEGLVVDYAASTGAAKELVRDTWAAVFPGEDLDAARLAAKEILARGTYLTRLYGRFSPEEMGVDLTFVPAAPPLGDVDALRIVPRENVQGCFADRADPCEFQACGQGGLCILTAGEDGAQEPACACVDGAAARAVRDETAPGGLRVSCVDVRMNVNPIRLLPRDETVEPIEASLPDPCKTDPCGEHGACFALNGQQTCQCERGFVAVARDDGRGGLVSTCVSPADGVPDDFYRRTLPEPKLPFPRGAAGTTSLPGDEGCTQSAGGASGRHAAWLLLGLPLLLTRRRRR